MVGWLVRCGVAVSVIGWLVGLNGWLVMVVVGCGVC